MYATDTVVLEDHFFRLRRDFTVRYVLEHFDAQSQIIDIGCGAGPVIAELGRAGYQCPGLDYSPDMLSNAQRRLHEQNMGRSALLRGDCEALPFRDAQFDCVICLGVISYVDDYQYIISEIHRILKPAGTAIISFRNFYNPILSDPVVLVKYIVKRLLFMPRQESQDIGRFLRFRDVNRVIEQNNFALQQFEGIGFGSFRLNYATVFSDATSIRLQDGISRVLYWLRVQWLFRSWTDVHVLIHEKRS